MRTTRLVLAASAVVLGAACAEGITSSDLANSELASAFNSTLLSFSSTNNSFDAASDTTFRPEGGGHHGGRGGGRHHGGPGDGFMGGFGIDFLGGPGGGHRPFDGGLSGDCTFNSSTGVITCAPVTRNGLTIVRTGSYTTAAGVAQSALDSLTNTITLHVTVDGTTTHHRDSVTSEVHHVSDRTVTGLAKGSTQRTVNGTASGTESSSGTNETGTFTAVRVVGDTTKALVIPVADGKPSYPTSGTVIRAMTVTVTYSGQAPTTSTRREVITYDGSSTATLVITQDGTTKNCTLPLPHGRPTCS